jgi:hypothetical protein
MFEKFKQSESVKKRLQHRFNVVRLAMIGLFKSNGRVRKEKFAATAFG